MSIAPGKVPGYGVVYGSLSVGLSMALKHALLGLLAERRGYGYDLKQRLGRLGWEVNPGGLYNALDRLETRGLIRPIAEGARSEARRRRSRRASPRVMYELTADGRRELDRWLVGSPRRAPMRDEFPLQLTFSRAEHLPRLIEITFELERECIQRLAEASNELKIEELLRRGEAWDAVSAVMVRDADAKELGMRIAWLREVRKTMQYLVDRAEELPRG